MILGKLISKHLSLRLHVTYSSSVNELGAAGHEPSMVDKGASVLEFHSSLGAVRQVNHFRQRSRAAVLPDSGEQVTEIIKELQILSSLCKEIAVRIVGVARHAAVIVRLYDQVAVIVVRYGLLLLIISGLAKREDVAVPEMAACGLRYESSVC